ncbi:hypothetical protein [Anaerorhabdus furcosa]|uniref:Neutral/alkaline non-lysosomal ceramidase, N-terminal n=1 Tax=Anaerorhabdus furcosa TaxID=118967 RepID=A0A1T4KTA2_9FIRM|nr:hypothetical protein [Anaerorhabdus furcosa]SJZ45641.1 hypothetical protein SAMN02745191_0693 [Anaerorhabdus furcosa]
MKYSIKTITIDSPFPIKQSGFIQQVNPISQVHDDLHARILSFEDNDKILFLLSCDNLGFRIHVQDEIERQLTLRKEKQCHVILSSTHTHFAPDPHDEKYQAFFIDKIVQACISLEYTESNLFMCYQHEKFDKVGRSRISNHTANVVLQTLSIYDGDKRVITCITHNCHPTILNGDTPFFSSEYPGYTLQHLSDMYKETFFTFFQGASGDISSRFTRISQDYAGVEYLGNILVNEVNTMLFNEKNFKSFDSIDFTAKDLPLEHDFTPIDLSLIPDGLTDREKETINIGIKVREELLKNPEQLNKEVRISRVKLGEIKLIFSPNELFSYYTKAINEDDSMLICYSNGYSPYVTGINENFITYEKFTDTLTPATKHALFDLIKDLSNN